MMRNYGKSGGIENLFNEILCFPIVLWENLITELV